MHFDTSAIHDVDQIDSFEDILKVSKIFTDSRFLKEVSCKKH